MIAILAAVISLALVPTPVIGTHSTHVYLSHTESGGPLGPHVHWSVNGHNQAYFGLVDMTGPNWPVSTTYDEWDDANNLNVDYDSSPGGCGSHCVDAVAFEFQNSCTSQAGNAHIEADSANGHMLAGPTRVSFNQKCNDEPEFARRKIVCQEVGHITGLDHRPQVSTCMHQNVAETTQATPDAHDYDALATHIYDHGN